MLDLSNSCYSLRVSAIFSTEKRKQVQIEKKFSFFKEK